MFGAFDPAALRPTLSRAAWASLVRDFFPALVWGRRTRYSMPTRKARSTEDCCTVFSPGDPVPREASRKLLLSEPRKKGLPYPSVPEAAAAAVPGSAAGADDDDGMTVGLSVWTWMALPIATVEIACLKINCS